MKTRTIFRNSFGLILLMAFSKAYPQACPGSQIAMTLENVRSTSAKTVEFDLYVTNMGTTSLSLAGVQGAAIFDPAMIPGQAAVTFTALSSTQKAGPFALLNEITTQYDAATRQLRWFQNPVSQKSKRIVELPTGKKMKLSSFKLSSSEAMHANLVAKIAPQTQTKFGYTKMLATVYCAGNANSVALKPLTSTTAIPTTGVALIATASPNPFTENFNLSLDTASETEVSVKVYDMLGKVIDQFSMEAGQLQQKTIGANYPSGIYTVTLSQGNNSETVRVIKR